MFIDVEGVDGVGKSTVIAVLYRMLTERGYRVHITREPSDGPIGRFIRDNVLKGRLNITPEALKLLFAADRAMHYASEIGPRLNEGYLVITERYIESSVAYQGAQGVSIGWILEVNSKVPKPDMVFILDAPMEVIARRISGRVNLEYFERNVEFLSRVREIYLSRAREMGYIVVDASLSPEEEALTMLNYIEGKAKGG